MTGLLLPQQIRLGMRAAQQALLRVAKPYAVLDVLFACGMRRAFANLQSQ